MSKEQDRNPRKVLGKGLSALLPQRVPLSPPSAEPPLSSFDMPPLTIRKPVIDIAG